MTVGDRLPDALAEAAAPQVCNVVIDVDGSAMTWQVWPARADAHAAAERDSGRAAPRPWPSILQQDGHTGFAYFSMVRIRRGVVSLDDLEEMQASRYTWQAELERAGVVRLAPGGENRLEGKRREDGSICWKVPPAMAKPGERSKSLDKKKRGSRSASTKHRKSAASSKDKDDKDKKHHDKAEGLWGRTFIVPGRAVGQGSYHFVSEGEVFLNYSTMPKMEDGSKRPSRCDFRDFSFDAEKRKFHGTIDMKTEKDTTTWVYNLTFDEKFIGITGKCRMFKEGATDSFMVMHFGKSCFYVREDATKEQVKKYMEANDYDKETKMIFDALGRAAEKDHIARQATGRGRPTGVEALNVIFGTGMQEYARDKSFSMSRGR